MMRDVTDRDFDDVVEQAAVAGAGGVLETRMRELPSADA